MFKKTIVLFILLIFLNGCSSNKVKDISVSLNTKESDFYTYLGYLVIPKINMKLGFYDYESKLNDVNKNIELINTGISNTYLIAAHSGTGTLAYFNDLRYLEINDEIYLKFKNKTNKYKIKNISRKIKDGKIKISKEENQIILVTCDQIVKGYNLIIEGKLIKN